MAESNRHPDVASELLRLGFKLISDSAYTFGFERRPGEIVYVKKTTKRSVVLDPRYFSDGEVIEGVAGYAYWNSNLHTFDKAPRGGKSPEHYGIAFDIPTPGHVGFLADALKRKV
jgi:hypothetical protein